MLAMLRALLAGPRATVTVHEAARLMGTGVPLVDVRDAPEWRQGHVPNAFHVPLAEVQARGAAALEERGVVMTPGDTVLLVCHSGMRSGLACQSLDGDGGFRAVNVTGGMVAWRRAGLPIESGPQR
jgi:rhodanese-related sulfurtransferase